MYTIMVVNDNETELVVIEKALEKDYQVTVMNNSKQALARLSKATIMPDLMLLDIAMPGINGFDMIMRMKTNEKMKEIPVMFLSGDKENATELEAYRLGAVDFIRKPIVAQLLRKRVELQVNLLETKKHMSAYNTQLQQNATAQAQNAYRLHYFIIGIITDLIASKDGFTGIHSVSVSRYMGIILKEMLMSGLNYGISTDDYELIMLSAQLHDMGKIGVPDAVLQKTGKYTDEEFTQMKNHTVYAANAIQKYSYLLPGSKFITYTYQMARSHHERFDGRGYPDGLQGANIPILARILAVADVYDALVSERSYKQAMSHEQAYNIITQGAGVQFDPQVVAAFQRVHMDIYDAAQKLRAQYMQQS
ncbi:MAG: response regulator [Lachnospiraceae bacterium]|nr:response regulator [Lachnospiraceae bacterium]